MTVIFRNDKTCITGSENATQLSEIIANLSKYNLTTETSVEQYWELVEIFQKYHFHLSIIFLHIHNKINMIHL